MNWRAGPYERHALPLSYKLKGKKRKETKGVGGKGRGGGKGDSSSVEQSSTLWM